MQLRTAHSQMTRLSEENERLRRQLAQVVNTLSQNPNNMQVHDSPADEEDLTRSRTPPKSNLRGLGKGIGKRQADEDSSSPDRACITAAPGLSGEDQVTVSSPSKQQQQQLKAASSSPAPDEEQDGMQQVQEDNIPPSSSALSDETGHASAPAAFNHRSSTSPPRWDVDHKTGLNQSCAPTADHHQQKEEENKTRPPKKMQKTAAAAAATLSSIKPVQQNNPHKEAEMSEPPTVVRKARVSVRSRCESPTVSSSFSKHNIPRSSSKT